MFDRIKLVLGGAMLGAMIGGLLGPVFGYEQVISTVPECYQHQVIDHTFEYCAAGLGALFGLYCAVKDYIQSQVDPDHE